MFLLLIIFLKKKTFTIMIFLSLLDFILLGGILPLLERKFLSLIQRRVGPHYVGYKGRLQFIADALKVFFKDFIYLGKINNVIYLMLPFIYIYINGFLFLFFYYDINITLFDSEYYLIYLYILVTFSNIILFFSGLFSKNKYTIISSTRICVYIFSLDLMFSIFLLILIMFSQSFHIYNLKQLKFGGLINIGFIPLIPIIVIIFLFHSNKAPYDLFEAESELVLGYTTEYSGFLFGIYVLTEYLHIFFFAFLIHSILF